MNLRKTFLVSDLQARLDRVVARLNDRFEGRDGQRTIWCETGDQYVTVCSAGPKPEGEETHHFSDPVEAIDRWIEEIWAFVGSQEGRIYWRARPTLECGDNGNRTVWTVFCRLVVTAKPETDVCRIKEAAEAA